MAYERLNLTDGTVMTASHVKHLEDGIANAATAEAVIEQNNVIGNLADLATSNKNSLVEAINEAQQSGGAKIDDTAVSEDTTWSGKKINNAVGQISEENAKVKSDLAELVTEIKNVASGNDTVFSSTCSNWTKGRIDSGSFISSNYDAYTTDIILENSSESISFDTTKYKALISFWKEDGTRRSSTSWITTSPINPWALTLAHDGSIGYRIGLRTLDSGDIDLTDLKQNVIFSRGTENKIASRLDEIERSVYVHYVSSANGNDLTGDGSESKPYATINKAIGNSNDTAKKVIYVESGDYAEKISIQNKSNISIALWNTPTFSTNVKELPLIHIIGTNNCLAIYNCNKVELSDMWFDQATETVAECNRVRDLNLTHCIFSNSGDGNCMGLKLLNCNAVVKNCIAYNIGRDGFNIHGYGNTQFIDCIAYDCGDDGISHHDGCTGIIIGGEFYRCVKGGVASPAYGAKVDIEGVYSHDNAYGIYTTTSGDYGVSETRVSNCVLKNNTTKDLLVNGCNMVAWNNIYGTKQIIDGYTLTEYN